MTPNNRRGPALTKTGKGYTGKAKSKTDGQKTSCCVCGRVGHMAKRLLAQGNEQGQCTQQPGQERQRWRQEQCERSHDSIAVDDHSTSGNLSQSHLENHPRRHLGPSRPHVRVTKLDTSWQRSGTKNHSVNPKTGWYVAHILVGNCADEHVCSPRDSSGSPLNKQYSPSGIGEWAHTETPR